MQRITRPERMTLRRAASMLALGLLCVGALPACDDSPSSPTLAALTLTATPASVTAKASTVTGFSWNATFVATLAESAGTGATISTIAADVKEASGGIPVNTGGTVLSQVKVSPSGSRVAAGGSVTLDFTIEYKLPNGGREAVVDVTVVSVDDNNVQLSRSVRVPVV